MRLPRRLEFWPYLRAVGKPPMARHFVDSEAKSSVVWLAFSRDAKLPDEVYEARVASQCAIRQQHANQSACPRSDPEAPPINHLIGHHEGSWIDTTHWL